MTQIRLESFLLQSLRDISVKNKLRCMPIIIFVFTLFDVTGFLTKTTVLLLFSTILKCTKLIELQQIGIISSKNH